MSEGYMKRDADGRYEVAGDVLTCGRCLTVRIAGKWLPVRVEYDGVDYYLLADDMSFYPITVYARTR